MRVVCGYLIVCVFIDDDNKLGSWKKKKKKKTLKKIEFQNETVKYKIVFVIERNS